jgi:hypothetical protein
VPPSTPFQPGAPPSPPLQPFIAGLGGLLLLGQFLWDLLNSRPKERDGRFDTGERIEFGPTDQPIIATGTRTRSGFPLVSCSSGEFGGINVDPTSQPWETGGLGIAASFTGGGGPSGWVNNSGTGIRNAFMTLYRSDGSTATIPYGLGWGTTGPNTGPFGLCGTGTVSITISGVTYGGSARQPAPIRPPLLPQVAPAVPQRSNPEVAPVPAVPVPAPAPAPQPAPAPDEAVPIPAPAAPPAPGRPPAVAPAVPALPGRAPNPVRPATPVQPGAVPITAGGVRPQLPPAPVPTNTGTTVLPGGQQLAPNGPAPTPQAIATELGKLEQKLEIMLNPQEELSFLDRLNRIIDQTENIKFLLETLFPPEPYTFPPGGYTLAAVCDRDAEGNLIEPKVAPWDGGEGELLELRQKLDALAVLMQHHKDLKQPTCGGRGSGPHSNVTVHFESD